MFQNIDIIDDMAPRHIVLLAGDHVYKMDYELMLQQHVEQGADVTVGCIAVPRMEATAFGVMHVDETGRIVEFIEKPADPPRHSGPAGDRRWPAWASMSSRPASCSTSCGATPTTRTSSHDFGKDIIPCIVQQRQGGGAPLRAFAASAPAGSGALLAGCRARSMPIGKPIST